MRKALSMGLMVLAMAGSTMAGRFSDGLERYVADHPGDGNFTVLLGMTEQAPIASLDQQLRDSQAPLYDRHDQVVSLLMDTATRSQADLLSELALLKDQGKVKGFTSHWLVNGIVVNADLATLRVLAARPDVDVAEVDLQVELIAPIQPEVKEGAEAIQSTRVATPGVQTVRAPDVWNLLGIDGSGALVGVLDTGVQESHSALSSRYRGNNGAPDSECWIDAAGLGDSTPIDQHYHGTHVMGTICGGAPGEEIGVAPGAQWIASNVINMSTGSGFDNAVIASLEFMTDPDGNPGSIDDVPDVVQNSWGVNEGFSGYIDCDTRWWTAIDNCEAAGVCLTWSAGNEGSGSQTMRSPADRATTAYNAFSVGSTLNDGSGISSFSSRGPSGCGGAFAIKPEVMAPGSDIRSAEPGGGYQNLSGTSMAGPHVAGVVALMRSANPNVDVQTIKQVLMDTAYEMASDGTPGEDNNYGHGMVDAYEAVLAVMSGYGSLVGTVTNASNGNPIDGAVISNAAGPQSSSSNGTGTYEMFLAADTYNISYEAFGYVGQTVNGVSILDNTQTTVNMALSPAASALLYGYVYDPDGLPVVGASITVDNAPVAPTSSGAGGYYELTIPIGYTYDLTASSAGLGELSQSLFFPASSQLDFFLPIDPMFLPTGPDAYGYRIFDSNDAGGVPFEWTDISSTGTALTLSDDSNQAVTVGFTYNMYGTAFSDLSIGSNGLVTAGTSGVTSWTNSALPAHPGSVYALWDDLNPGSGGTVYYEYRPGEGRFIVQYDGVVYYGTGDPNYFQIILLDPAVFPSESGDAQWIVQFQGTDRGSCTVGIESPSTGDYLQYVFNNAFDVNATPYANGPIALLMSSNEYGFGPIEDVSAPIIAHTALSNTQDTVGPYVVQADITDYSGVASATLDYRFNGGAWTSVGMSTLELYSASIPGPTSIGTLIEYQIHAADASDNSNSGSSPVYGFQILAPTGLEYCQDFENGLDDFSVVAVDPSGNVWTTTSYGDQGQTAYISYSSWNQEDHSLLNSPAFDCSGQATVQLDFWHRLHMGYSGYWSDAYVRGSIDGGLTWPILISEWHSTDGGGSDFIIEGAETFDISSWAAGAANVAIQFEFHDLYDWDWYVDDVCLTGTLANVEVDPVDLQILFVSPSSVSLSWTPVPNATSYDVYEADALGMPYSYIGNTSGNSFVQGTATVDNMKLYQVISRLDVPTEAVSTDRDRLHNMRSLRPDERQVK